MGSSGWNRPSANQPKRSPKKPSALRGVAAGLVVVAAIAAVFFFLFSGDSGKVEIKESEKNPTRIKRVTPAPAPKAATNEVEKAPEKPARLTKKGTPIPDRVRPDEKGILRYPNGQRWVDPNDLHMVEHPKPRALFKHSSENRIAVMLQLDPTKMDPLLLGRRHKYDERFVEDFKASMNDTIVIDKDDTPEEAEIRKAVLETKADLKAALDRGEDIAKMMNDAQEELDRLCQYHADIKKMVRDVVENPEFSDKDVEDYVNAANQMLEKQGITKLAMPKLIHRQAHLMLARERQKRREELGLK